MQKRIYTMVSRSFLVITMLFVFNGCASTRTQDGISIEKKSGNPLKFW